VDGQSDSSGLSVEDPLYKLTPSQLDNLAVQCVRLGDRVTVLVKTAGNPAIRSTDKKFKETSTEQNSHDHLSGVVRYIGSLDKEHKIYAGIHLDSRGNFHFFN